MVLVNSQAAEYSDFRHFLEPYLSQFGVPYEVRDLARERIGADLGTYALIIIGHRGLDVTHRFVSSPDEQKLLASVSAGTGLVSFDGLLAGWSDGKQHALYQFAQEIFGFTFVKAEQAAVITVGAGAVEPHAVPVEHYITRSDSVPRTVTLKRPMTVPGIVPGARATPVAYAGNQPLLVTARHGRGRAVLWTSYEWTRPDTKGKLYGLDDLVWRSLVWAARKPFLLRGMPHYLALRIDDVSGFGLDANRHLGYVATANRYGLKPWIGIFINDLGSDPEAVRALALLTQQGLATASVHARTWNSFFYLDEPLWSDERGTNIAAQNWADDRMAANCAEASGFFSQHGIPMSKYVIPHFYEFGTNNFACLESWGAEFVGTVVEPGRGYGSPILPADPYLAHQLPRPSNTSDPVFIADWLEVPGHAEFNHRFFNFVEEVRDVTGYEWAPSHVSVTEAIRRGVVESRREFDSLLPAVLFTHESDHIQYLQPEEWDHILEGVMENLKPYQPIPVTLDFLAQYLRALHTSKIASVNYDAGTLEGVLELDGAADLATKFYVFESSEGDPVAREWQAPAFHGRAEVRWQ